jgi:hypothetical protein
MEVKNLYTILKQQPFKAILHGWDLATRRAPNRELN